MSQLARWVPKWRRGWSGRVVCLTLTVLAAALPGCVLPQPTGPNRPWRSSTLTLWMGAWSGKAMVHDQTRLREDHAGDRRGDEGDLHGGGRYWRI